MIYQLTEDQYSSLYRMANMDEEVPMLTVVSPIRDDDDPMRKALIASREEAFDLQGLGLIRNDDENLLKIAQAVGERLGRSTRVYTLTPLGFKMFHGSKNRSIN